jgi:hypothetical protein
MDTYVDLRDKQQAARRWAEQYRDPMIGGGRLRPPFYYPTERNFTLYRPGFQAAGWIYGDLDDPEFRRSPTLMGSVLERRWVASSVDAHGFRETVPLDDARVLALGDSFVNNPTLTQELGWPKVLQSLIGEPVYNLGIDMSGPAQQVWLLDHVLRTWRPRSARRVLWMIFEGNDLEDDYSPTPDLTPQPFSQTLAGTLTTGLAETIRDTSVLRHLLRGDYRLRRSGAEDTVDGVELTSPLWRSERFGRALVWGAYLDRVALPESYVLDHPNRPALERTFAEMKQLAATHHLDVTVVLAPSFPRLYAAAFGHPEVLSREPHVLRFVERLATRTGFGVVNLADLMRPYAERELLYFRDDTHWNARGNRVVAELVARHAFGP